MLLERLVRKEDEFLRMPESLAIMPIQICIIKLITQRDKAIWIKG